MYTTTLGDTWDIIAKKVYKDEKYAGVLMENNIEYLNFVYFPSGVELLTPELEEEQVKDLPPWR